MIGQHQDYWSGNLGLITGVSISLVAHLMCLLIAIFVLERSASRIWTKGEIFTVTLEGGAQIGGISQVPEEGAESKKKVLPHAAQAEKLQEQAIPQKSDPVHEKKLTSPSLVDDPEIILALKKEEKQKRILQEKLKLEAEKKKKDEERQKKLEAEEEKKREQEKLKKIEEQKNELLEKKKRDQSIQAAIKAVQNRYKGKSADAGGERVFGAAALGGKGMGGGTPVGAEFLAYRNELVRHIKSGWHWLPGGQPLVAQIRISILPSGEIQMSGVRVTQSSGNESFDESAIRAVEKASPVPAPPEHLYDTFREVDIFFDSER